MKVREIVDKFLVLKPFLTLLSEGRIFKLVFSWFLRVVAGITAIGFLVEWFTMWPVVFENSGSMVFVMILLMILSVAVVFGIINVVLVKADIIAALPETKDYIVLPIAVVFIKLTGEIFAFIFTFIGLAGFLVSLTDAGKMILKMLPFFGKSSIEGGIAGLVISLIVAFFSFFFAYFIAEQIGALADIARNTKK